MTDKLLSLAERWINSGWPCVTFLFAAMVAMPQPVAAIGTLVGFLVGKSAIRNVSINSSSEVSNG